MLLHQNKEDIGYTIYWWTQHDKSFFFYVGIDFCVCVGFSMKNWKKIIRIVACVNNRNNWIISHQKHFGIELGRMWACDTPCIENYIIVRCLSLYSSVRRILQTHIQFSRNYIINYNHISIHQKRTRTRTRTSTHSVISGRRELEHTFLINHTDTIKQKPSFKPKRSIDFYLFSLVEGPFHHHKSATHNTTHTHTRVHV